jgi:hypothetical protein
MRSGVALAAAVSLSLVLCGSALATTGHTFAGQFGGGGTGDGQFSEPANNGPAGLAVMPSTGEVFAAGNVNVGGSTRMQRFSAAGVFQSVFPVDPSYIPTGAIAIDPAGAVYVAAWLNPAGHVLKYSDAGDFVHELDLGSSETTLNEPLHGTTALAVDPADGTVYAAATNGAGAPVVDSFDRTTGAFLASFDGSNSSPDGTGFCAVSSLAVDASHQVYVADVCKGRVERYDATGVWQVTVDDGGRGLPSAVAVDPVSGEVYVSEAGPRGLQITHFTAGGAAPVNTFDASNVGGGVRALAVSGDGTVYASDATRPFVERFTRFDGPTVVTGSATQVDGHTETLNGTINPEGVASSYHFEYGLDQRYGSRTPDVSAGGGSSAVPATADATGLSANTTYHFRIVGSNSSGSIAGADMDFTTGAAPAIVDPKPPFASAITPRSARLYGTINPNKNVIVTWHIEYGTTTAYGSTAVSGVCFLTCDGADRLILNSDGSVPQALNLEPDTTYHFRVVADFDGLGGTQEGVDQTFTTSPAQAAGATDVTTKRATLTGTINPHATATTYHFSYGLTSDYGTSTPELGGGDADGDQTVTQQISGLLPATTYHVQVVATTNGVTRSGADGRFTTAPAPTATAISPTSVSTSAVMLAGEIDTHGLPGTYHFVISSLDSSYAGSTGDQAAPGGFAAERVTASMTGLPAGETFVVRLVVTSNDHTEVSDQITFATAPQPRLFPTTPAGDARAAAYGCASPRLDAYNARPNPGDTITISGRDLGLGGNVALGDRSFIPADWSATAFKLQIPDDATGTMPLTVNCGRLSNTIAVAIFREPDNAFSITSRSVAGSAARLSVKVPGPGKLETSGSHTKATKTTITKGGTATVRVRLTAAGAKSLARAKSRALKVIVHVRFTPAGGRPATKDVSLTFKRQARPATRAMSTRWR